MTRAIAIVVGVLALGTTTAVAAPPSGYRCGAGGKAVAGKGCSCPAGKSDARDGDGTAICIAHKAKVSEVPPEIAVSVAACDGGDGEACKTVAHAYDKGLDVDEDQRKAFAFYSLACKVDELDACYEVGDRYYYGNGVAENARAALALYERSCRKGDALSCLSAAFMHHNGEGAKADAAKAIDFYRQACDLRDGLGCDELGEIREGEYGERYVDLAEAARLYERSCEYDTDGGCDHLGNLYRYGKGVAVDAARAIQSYRKACKLTSGQTAASASSCASLKEMCADRKDDACTAPD